MKTEQDLLDACRRLHDSGSRLSVRSLKKELGGGSTDRIAATLRKFKESVFDEHQDQKNEHPDELFRSIQDLHEKYEELKSSHELRVQEINELKKHIVKLQDRYTRDIRILKNENSKLKKKLSEVSDEEDDDCTKEDFQIKDPRQKSLLENFLEN